MSTFRIDYSGSANTWTKTPQGGLLAKGRLTRTGVLTYQNQDGSTRRELRHPDEVFAPDSLATLHAAPLTRLHPTESVRADNWQALAVGHVGEDVRAEGQYVSASVRVQDAKVAADVESGRAKEFSCGYFCELEATPGTYQGEHYDAIQRNIRYNHVGIGPVGWGRAGSEVAIRADGVSYHRGVMTLDEALAALAAERTNTAALQKRNDELQGRLDSAVARADAAEKRTPDESDIEARVDARLSLLSAARDVLGDKAPAKGTDRDIRVAVIVAETPDFKADGRSDDYVSARFDAIVEGTRAARTKSNAVRSDARASHSAPIVDPADKARQDMIERNRNAWKTKVS